MKKIFSTLIIVLGFSIVGFSQTQATIANSEGKSALVASKTSGEYVFTLPASATEEQVSKSAGYYTDYFTVAYDDASKVANITMVQNNPQSRSIIARFLSAIGVREVAVDGTNLQIGEFFETYLK